MSYPELLQRLFHLSNFGGIKYGLENTLRLASAVGDPHQDFPTIHVAGSNGKGSVSTKIAHAYQSAGYKTGLYTSPHIATFRERIRINGTMISEQAVEKHLKKLFDISQNLNISATFFEITTVLALLFFAESKVDIVVLEAGLGGRLDATNIVTPILSVISSISLEHTEILGTTIEEITAEKAGIIKPGVPVVIGPNVSRKLIEGFTKSQDSICLTTDDSPGTYDDENNAIASCALEFLKLPKEAISDGLAAIPSCRMEIHYLSCPVILDVGHNPDGLTRLFQGINHRYPSVPLRVVCGLSASKDIKGCLSTICRYTRAVHLTEANCERAAPLSMLVDTLKSLGVEPAPLQHSVQDTVNHALELATTNSEMVIVCGSFFIMAAAREALGIEDEKDSLFITDPAVGPHSSSRL